MAGSNLNQIYTANPITTNAATDLMYFMQSPYGSGTDAGMKYSDFAAQFPGKTGTGASGTWSISISGNAATASSASSASSVALSGITGLGTGIATALAINVGSAGAPVLFNGAGGTPSSMTATNLTGTAAGLTAGAASAVALSGITGLGTGVATALAINTSSAGSIVLFNGAAGTPTSLTLTNATGLPVAGGGTGNSTFTAYSVICAGTTATGAFQNVSGLGTSGYVLTSNGAGALPSWQAAGGGSSPWSAGSGTGSAQGGDGSSNAAGNYSVVYGENSCETDSGTPATIVIGNACTATNGSGYSALFGLNSTLNSASVCLCVGNGAHIANANYAAAIGDNIHVNASFSFAFGVSCTTNNAYSWAVGNGSVANNQGSMVWSDHNGSPVQDSASDQWVQSFKGGYIWATGSTPAAVVKIDSSGNLINIKGMADQSYSYQTPSTGFSITIGAGVRRLALNPSGTLATGTITMPASPIDGQLITITSSQIVTSCTIQGNSGQTLLNAPGALAAGQSITWFYNLANTQWVIG